jgi:hypothetical protein
MKAQGEAGKGEKVEKGKSIEGNQPAQRVALKIKQWGARIIRRL